MRSLCYENQFSFILKLQLITITKISHLDSLWEIEGNSEMAYCKDTISDVTSIVVQQGKSWNLCARSRRSCFDVAILKVFARLPILQTLFPVLRFQICWISDQKIRWICRKEHTPRFWSTEGNRKWTFRMPGQFLLQIFKLNRLCVFSNNFFLLMSLFLVNEFFSLQLTQCRSKGRGQGGPCPPPLFFLKGKNRPV